MARSSYVYVAMDNGLPIAGFTVKHEMMSWLEKQSDRYKIYRLSDGPGYSWKEPRPPVDMTEDVYA